MNQNAMTSIRIAARAAIFAGMFLVMVASLAGCDPSPLPALDRSTDVRGPDLNGNGIRDDIDAFISAQTLDDPQRRAMVQVAKSIQTTLFVKLDDADAVQAVSEANTAADACLLRLFKRSGDQRGGELLMKLEAITANTPERAQRYMQYMRALSGTSVAWPRGDTCEP